jgi:hypothetical protein
MGSEPNRRTRVRVGIGIGHPHQLSVVGIGHR